MREDPGPYHQVGTTTDRGWFGAGFYFSPFYLCSLVYAQRHSGGGGMLIVKVLVGGVNNSIRSFD